MNVIKALSLFLLLNTTTSFAKSLLHTCEVKLTKNSYISNKGEKNIQRTIASNCLGKKNLPWVKTQENALKELKQSFQTLTKESQKILKRGLKKFTLRIDDSKVVSDEIRINKKIIFIPPHMVDEFIPWFEDEIHGKLLDRITLLNR